MTEAQRYIRSIRNAAKRSYAESYLAWISAGRLGHNGPEWDRAKLSFMGAQSVRMNLDSMVPDVCIAGNPAQNGVCGVYDCVCSPSWREYDAAAEELARKGLTGDIGDPLPNLMSSDACKLIDDDPEAFQVRVRRFAYALAMNASE